MFTGLIEDLGAVARLDRGPGGAVLTVATRLALASDPPRLGDSVAVNGACLTVTQHRADQLTFDVSLESLDRTALGALAAGDQVHLERALKLGARLDGHLVQGHVDGTAPLVESRRDGDGWRLTYQLPAALLGQVVEKGSIAIDGVSLTIAALSGERASVAVVPHTARETLLTRRPIGARANIETDLFGKYVERLFSLRGASAMGGRPGVTMALLAEHGWLK